MRKIEQVVTHLCVFHYGSVCIRYRHEVLLANGRVHRAAANDIYFMTRAARGSVCNPLLHPHLPRAME
ncbi:hypothetical protein Pan14r_44150 [Crateriforma conspicua]|uniref:Uncharacterized protein n=1 Tax=Crateriforma conspicua TaxID=2527996 RepID=A0A5C5YAY2_9PLAN|nr:hypothetical protein Pan14r_44150 [Crateriforma conspicua]